MIQALVTFLLRAALVQSTLSDPLSWDDSCSPDDPALKIHSLSVPGDPIEISDDQPIMVSFDSTVNHEIGSDVTVSLKIKKKEAFIWVDIPCVDKFGSCSYNLCDMVTKQNGTLCPILQKMGKQCQCPFKTGDYKLDNYPFKVDTSKIPGPIRSFGDVSYHEGFHCNFPYFLTIFSSSIPKGPIQDWGNSK